jgi:UDP-N-acetylmuramoyl-L-alanyl-D-glutamate--2,6-diaminopimelate ligase
MTAMHTIDSLILRSEVLEARVAPNLSVKGISEDSRKIKEGFIYFAIFGTKSDGHAFIQSALESGAAAVVVEDAAAFHNFPKTIYVESARKVFASAAARWFSRPSEKLDLVGITGTNGKTTSCFVLSHLWKSLGFSTGVIGTIHCEIGDEIRPSHLTTPGPWELQSLFQEMVDKKVQKVVMEVSSIALDQHRVWGSRFLVGLFTNLTQDHLDYHGSFENYYAAKLKFFQEYSLPVAVINLDDPWGKRLSQEARAKKILGFSLKSPADFSISEAKYFRDHTEARLKSPEGIFALKTPFIGEYNLANCVGVVAAAFGLGIKVKEAVAALQTAQGIRGRLERVASGAEKPYVFVDYAHTPDGLLKVLQELNKVKAAGSGKLITVFGCGGDRDRTKRPVMGKIAEELSDVVVVTSDNPRTEEPDQIVTDIEEGMKRPHLREVNRKLAIELALEKATPEDIVLIAGKGHETYQIIGTEQFPFDDAEVVRDFYRRIR